MENKSITPSLCNYVIFTIAISLLVPLVMLVLVAPSVMLVKVVINVMNSCCKFIVLSSYWF